MTVKQAHVLLIWPDSNSHLILLGDPALIDV